MTVGLFRRPSVEAAPVTSGDPERSLRRLGRSEQVQACEEDAPL